MTVLPFVGVALAVCDKMHIADKNGQRIVMMFCKRYAPEKIGRIVINAQKYPWWEQNPKAAFMKSVGEINRAEKAVLQQ
jgi:hypothetical protein